MNRDRPEEKRSGDVEGDEGKRKEKERGGCPAPIKFRIPTISLS